MMLEMVVAVIAVVFVFALIVFFGVKDKIEELRRRIEDLDEQIALLSEKKTVRRVRAKAER